ncbi:MAG: GNAT family N-acetyltransferase [Euryarchaeota archaeon]|nr:GNAT family N-acetyltransferase [Euryarchaeota archaeon]MDE1835644.1 GNAT family N-acetyltransferase [Euryarchaeota archaeon]MDE1878992.1 GNAT family N-acetyltransferase [Euryarchaeota archaeon]MDE2043734.1 GNAT family N-acetyltransferase [Thermoplasmata archaeon]
MVDVELIPMTPEEFGPYLAQLVPSYAESHVRTGRWSKEESLEASRKEIDNILPKGLETPNEHLFTIHVGRGRPRVGVLWLHAKDGKAFVYELQVDEPQRRNGFGRAAMLAAEPIARRLGAKRIALHVFGDNAPARALYRDLGYLETNVQMAKEL